MSTADAFNLFVWGSLFLITAIKFVKSIVIVPNRREYIVERLGRYHQTLGPGFHVLLPFLDRVAYIADLREESMDVPPQECFTSDNVKVEVDGVIYISVTESKNAAYGVTDYRNAAVSLAQTTTRSVIGTLDLDRTFEEREAINARVVAVLSEVGHGWGIQVHRYEVKNIMTPPSVRDDMERQMAAERERRALLARSEGDKQANINESEGIRREMINRSEGERQRRMNEAQGRAAEILAIAKAKAHSIRQIAGVLAEPGGRDAMRLQLGESYFATLGELANAETQVLVPANLTDPDELLDTLGLPSDSEPTSSNSTPRQAARPIPR
ncbi:MAG: SPFH domain-containing protein [Myxococcota bacterium]|nr:SPFH domain-containing protein [Myxococcota bacterium]